MRSAAATAPRQGVALAAPNLGFGFRRGGHPAHHGAGLVRILLADELAELQVRAGGDLARRIAGQQAVQKRSQGVDIAGRGDGLAQNLLGTGVLGRHGPRFGHRQARGLGRMLWREDLGDPEIQQLGHALGGHQDVAGFQIAVHHQILMGVMHRRAHLLEQLQPRLDRQPPPADYWYLRRISQ